MVKNSLNYIIVLICIVLNAHAQNSWQSQIVYYDQNDKLKYESDSLGNIIPDFSYAGYRNGGVPIPDVPVVNTISPISGDNTAHISNALFQIALMPADSNGIRGALLLDAGIYEIHGTINLGFDGVTLRGVGDGNDTTSNTILKGIGNNPHQRTILIAGGGGTTKWADAVPGTQQDIVTDSVMVGERIFEVTDASPYSIGDNIIIYHPCTQAWLTEVDSGGTFWWYPAAEPGIDLPWSVNSQPIVYNRYITDIQGNQITIGAPVFNNLIRNLSQSYIYKYGRAGIRTNIGIENLRIDIETASSGDENHAWNAIDMFQIEDAWVKNCTFLHFGLSGVRTNTATKITVENCDALNPVSAVEGGRRYNFQVYTASQQILFKNCNATNGRHHYMSNGTSWTSGCVFLDCTSSGAYTSSEGHRRWSQGLLYDNLIELDGPRPGWNPRLIGLYNRGYYGTSHGWAAVNSVAWGCDVRTGDLIVQKPPTAQNYAIGCFGNVTGIKPPAPFNVPEGYIEGTDSLGLEPRSLYYAQLADRLGPAVKIEENTNNKNLPINFTLFQNFPNPFNPTTTIQFFMNKASKAKLEIFNVLGQRVLVRVIENTRKGMNQTVWNGEDNYGINVGSGVYFYSLTNAGYKSKSKKMILLK